SARRVLNDSAEQLAFQRVDSNVIVRDARWIDQAAHDNSSALYGMSNCPIAANRVGDRPAPESLHGADQPGQFGSGGSSSSETCLIRLPGFRNRRVAQIDAATVQDARGSSWTNEQHGAGPAGLHGESNCRGRSTAFVAHGVRSPATEPDPRPRFAE